MGVKWYFGEGQESSVIIFERSTVNVGNTQYGVYK